MSLLFCGIYLLLLLVISDSKLVRICKPSSTLQDNIFFFSCIEDPLAHYSGAKCQICNCKCRCLPCWATFIRKLWTCCNCMFPCCHCCQPPIEHDYHIARQKKMKWPDFSTTRRPSKVPSKVHMENEKESRKTKSKSKKISEQVSTFSRKKKYSKKKIAEKAKVN